MENMKISSREIIEFSSKLISIVPKAELYEEVGLFISHLINNRIDKENKEFKLIDDLKIEPAKSKNAVIFLKKIFGDKPNALLIASTDNQKIKRLVSNIKNIDAIGAKSLNIYDLLKYKNILSEKKAMEEISKHYD